MKKTFRNFLTAVSGLALLGFVAACSGGSQGSNDKAATEGVAAEQAQQTPFEAAARIVKDLPKDYETMTEAQTNEFLAQAKPLCEETNGKPAQIEVAPGLEIKLSNVRYEEWRPGDNSIKVVIKADPDKSVADMRVLCLDKDNKIVFNNMLSNSTDTNHQFVSGWVAPDNAEKWGSVVRFVLVTGEIGNPLKTGDTYNQ